MGHHVNSDGISPLPDKVQSVQDFPPPQSLTKLREFLGLVNFYRRFIPDCAGHMSPLTDLLKSKVKNRPIQLTPSQLQSFEDVKTALAQATLLQHPVATAPLSLMVDASDFAVGDVLHQSTIFLLQTSSEG